MVRRNAVENKLLKLLATARVKELSWHNRVIALKEELKLRRYVNGCVSESKQAQVEVQKCKKEYKQTYKGKHDRTLRP